MREFKFFQKKPVNPPYTIDILKRYHTRLDDLYSRRYNYPYDSDEYGRTCSTFFDTRNQIDNGLLSNPSEIRNHVRLMYFFISGEIYHISDERDMIIYNEAYINHLEDEDTPLGYIGNPIF
jgi:hypothetical protein